MPSTRTAMAIRRKSDGKFSNGRGTSPSFTEDGKLFLRAQDMKRHLTSVYGNPYSSELFQRTDFEVVTYVLHEIDVTTLEELI